jgi:argininosuccinate synthase
VPDDVDVTVIVEIGDEDMDDQIKQQMAQQLHNSNRRLDDVAERFQTTMSFTEARANQQWQTGSTMLFPLTQNIIEKGDIAADALRKKVAENSAPNTQGG